MHRSRLERLVKDLLYRVTGFPAVLGDDLATDLGMTHKDRQLVRGSLNDRFDIQLKIEHAERWEIVEDIVNDVEDPLL